MPALSSFPSGSRVVKPSAIKFDYAWKRVGTVQRIYDADGVEHFGVIWDGEDARTFEYPPDAEMSLADQIQLSTINGSS